MSHPRTLCKVDEMGKTFDSTVKQWKEKIEHDCTLESMLQTINDCAEQLDSVPEPMNAAVAEPDSVPEPMDAAPEPDSVPEPMDGAAPEPDSVPKPMNVAVAEPDSVPEPMNAAVTELDSFPEPMNAAVAEPDSFPMPMNAALAELDSAPEPDSFPEPMNAAVAEPDSVPEPNAAVTELDSFPEPMNAAVAELDSVPKPMNAAVTELDSAPEPDSFPMPMNAAVAEPDSVPEPMNAAVTELDSFPEPMNAAVAELDSVPKPMNAAVTELDSAPEPDSFPKPMNAAVAELGSVPEPMDAAAPEPDSFPEPMNAVAELDSAPERAEHLHVDDNGLKAAVRERMGPHFEEAVYESARKLIGEYGMGDLNSGSLVLLKRQLEVGHAAGFQITGDNVDLLIKAKHMSSTNQNKSIHWFNLNAVLDRVLGNELSGEKPLKSIMDMENVDFLPSVEDNQKFLHDLIPLAARVIADNIPAFKKFGSVVVRHIPHAYSQAMKEKSTQVNHNTALQITRQKNILFLALHSIPCFPDFTVERLNRLQTYTHFKP